MKISKTVMWTALSVGALGMLGCDVFLGGRSRQEQVYVEPQPQYVVVQQAPPPLVVERRPPMPAGGYVWVDGYWVWDNQQYNWVAGHYVQPPQPNVIWIAPRYERDPRGYRYMPGQWGRHDQGNGRGRER
ncbi:MAG: YXWGXW repeat-containing protein [Phycisphaerae bacterium]